MSDTLLHGLDLAGVAVFAISGALAAGRQRMDLFGVLVLAAATALGGGTLRDAVLDRGAAFWVSQPIYLVVVLAAALATLAAQRFVHLVHRHLLWADACGLAVFSVVGAQAARDASAGWVVCIVMGVVTGVAGGIVRDLLCREAPLILHREIYATAAFLGAGVYVAGNELGLASSAAASLGVASALLLRLAALRWQLSLPVFELPERD